MKREIARGAAWMLLWRVCDRLLGLLSTLVLARLLVPADFGLVAMAMSFIALIELASAFSFEVALIQRSDLTRDHYDTAWTLNVAFALICGTLIALAAPMAAKFYAEPRLVEVMWVLGAIWALQGFENIGIVNFRRQMNFSREFTFMFGKRIAAFLVTLGLALTWQSYWALIAGQLTSRLVGVLLSYVMEPYRPRLSLAARRELFAFSSWLMITNVMGFGLARLPHLVVGRVAGSEALGLYTMASEFARLPSTELSAPINRAVFPGLSRLSGDPAALQRVFVDVMSVTVALTLPASIGLALVAPVLVEVLLGPRWLAAAPILALLALSGAVEVVAANNGVAYVASGQTRMAAILSATKLAAMVSFAMLLVPDGGVMGIAWAEFFASALVACISTVVAQRLLRLSLRRLATALWRPFVATATMAACLWPAIGAMTAPGVALPPWLTLCAALVVGAVSYFVTLLGVWQLCGRPSGAEHFVVQRMREIFVSLMARHGTRT